MEPRTPAVLITLASVFQLVPTSGGDWTENVIYNFDGKGGAYPFAGVTMDQAGNLYGTSYQGGDNNYGTVYELSPSQSGWTETNLYSFTGGRMEAIRRQG